MLKPHTTTSTIVYLLIFMLVHGSLRALLERFGHNGFAAGSCCALVAVALAELIEWLYLRWRARRDAAREAAFSFLD